MITFSGLASGLDSGAIIEQMTAIERLPARVLEGRKADLSNQKSIVEDLRSKLNALDDAATKLGDPGEIYGMKATASDTDRIATAVSGLAKPGTYNIRVASLARAQSNVSRTYAATTGVLDVGSVDIIVGTDAPVTINFDATDSLDDVAARINDSDARVNAGVIFNGTSYQLMVTGAETGSANAVTFTETGHLLELDQPANQVVQAVDASLTLNGIAISRSTNVIDDLLAGVTFTAKAVHGAGDPDAIIEIASDSEKQAEILQGFVDAYNEVVGVVDDELSYTGETKGPHTLFGDSTLRSLQRQLGEIVSTAFPNGVDTISVGQLGIELGDDGRLTLDSATLESAMRADPNALESLFLGDGTNGLLAGITAASDLFTRSGDGLLTTKMDALDDRIEGFDDQIVRIEDNAIRLGERLARQFTALEQAISNLQSQQNFLESMLGGL